MKARNGEQSTEKLLVGDYVLREMFEDFYEHQIYFNLVNTLDISDLCPSDIEIELSTKVRRVRLSFPDEFPKLVKVIVPVTRAQNSTSKKRSEIVTQSFHKYSNLVPKMRLSIKSQIAALRKDLSNEKEAALIAQKVKEARGIGLRKVRAELAKKGVRKDISG